MLTPTSRRRTLVALIQFAGVVLCVPALILSEALPGWAVTASLVGLGLLPVVGLILAGRPFERTPVDLPLGLMLLLAPTTLLVATDRAAALPHVYRIIAGAAVFYGVTGLLLETRWFALGAWGICLLGLALLPALLLGTQWSGAKFSWLPWRLNEAIPTLFRPFWKPEDYQGFNPNLSGGLLATMLPVPIAYTLFASRGLRSRPAPGRGAAIRIAAGIESALIAALLLLTQSRGSLLAALVAVGAMLAVRNWRWLMVLALVLTGSIVVLRTTGLSPFRAADLESDVDSALDSIEGRIELWSRGWAIAQDFPFTGIGMGMVLEVMPLRYPTFRISPAAQIEHLHSIYANTAAEMGFPGLIALLALLIVVLILFWRAASRARESVWAPLAVGTLGTAVVVCVQGVNDTLFAAPKAYVIVMGIFAVGVAVALHVLYGAEGQ
jgi:hypothetical protein